ncbi:immune inhibitor A domain-containing protein [Anaerosoma tenue]|uniref:immune inhibitor A domain-containing protein n=1 Tax=Anaerosoma tenue TaxID=2933588 RepID=UPI002260DF98|nr:immune inhibitor A domain-containing protein [Anaerosoma tenue]MCK8114828.1 immune inhibitor A [Anaerosoma tenue]
MTRRTTRLVAIVAAFALLLSAAAAMGAVPRDEVGTRAGQMRQDKRPHPLGQKAAALRTVALEARVSGHAPGPVYEAAPGKFVDLELEGAGMVWTVPGEFPDYPHNSIEEPDRSVDNSTLWMDDFSEAYYDEMLYARGVDVNSMAEYFLEQSSGRYTVDGDCVDWVMVPETHEVYDDGDAKNDTSENVWLFLEDSLDSWYQSELAAGKTLAEIDAYLAQFDVYDRYDWDGDGVFDEPDGYIDHYQSLHAGQGEEEGGGALGDEAIWSHSWYACYEDIGTTGPSAEYLLGGIRVGESSYWIGDYTIQPENGGVGVFTHEFTHDLGAPDLYDYYGENGTGFWTLMSSGSWLSDNDYDLGSAPCHEDAWIKLQLGWLAYEVATPGEVTELTLGPAEYNSTQPQALLVDLGKKFKDWDIGDPYAGEAFYYSGQGDNLRNSMTKPVSLPATGAGLSAMVRYGIEEGYDYAAAIVSVDGGPWQTVPTSLSNSTVDENGIDGFSDEWVPLTVDLSAYAGQDVELGFQYVTDGGVAEVGFMVDDIVVAGLPLDGAETEAGWEFDGFKTTTGYESGWYWHYYLAEYRQYWGYDVALANCYNFGWLYGRDAEPDWNEKFAYQDGLLVWYCDTSQPNNDTANHPGQGIALPVDAHPDAIMRDGKNAWRNRVQTYDATFGLEDTDALTLHYYSREYRIPSLRANPVFDDALDYYDEAIPLNSVDHPHSGTRIEVLDTTSTRKNGSYMAVRVQAPLPEAPLE